MELKNLKDFYEKQEYVDYNESKNFEQRQVNKRIEELSFFTNIAVFSIFLVFTTYILVSLLANRQFFILFQLKFAHEFSLFLADFPLQIFFFPQKLTILMDSSIRNLDANFLEFQKYNQLFVEYS